MSSAHKEELLRFAENFGSAMEHSIQARDEASLAVSVMEELLDVFWTYVEDKL